MAISLTGALAAGGVLTLGVLSGCGTPSYATISHPPFTVGAAKQNTDSARIHRHHLRVFLPVLIYHHVKPLIASDDAIERGLTVLPDEFLAEMRYLKRHAYHPVTVSRAVDYLMRGRVLPSRPVAITFDDGYSDVYQTAYHTLRRYHFPATFFIVPGFLNAPRYLTWNAVETMAKHGMDIEAHTMTHPDLAIIPANRVRWELTQSRWELQQHIHQPIRIMAYPYGAFNAAVLSAVRHAGYRAAFTTHQGWRLNRDSLLTLPRVYVDLDDTVSIFAGRLRAEPRILAEDPS